MIRSDVLFETSAIDNLEAFLEAYPGLASETVKDTFNHEIKSPMLAELRHTPGPARHPFRFATPKSRRWYFWAVATGLIPTDGERYIRTGETMAAWEVDVVVGDGAAIISARNRKRHIRWLTGSRQVPGHANTGWPKHDETLDYWANVTRDETRKALNRLINHH